MLNYEKTNSISGEILRVKGDSKKLYQVVNELTTSLKENPLPQGLSEDQLAEDFATFFLEKIQKIRQQFEAFPIFKCEADTSIPIFRKFDAITEQQILKLISEMKQNHVN